MRPSRRTAIVAAAVAAAFITGGAVSATTSSSPPQLTTVAYVGTYKGSLSGFPGNWHKVSVLMKRGNTSAFGKNQTNFILVESFECRVGAGVPVVDVPSGDCRPTASTSMRNNGPGASVSSTGRSAVMKGTFTSRSGAPRTLRSTLSFHNQAAVGEKSFGYDMAVRNNHGRVTGTVNGKKAQDFSLVLTTMGK